MGEGRGQKKWSVCVCVLKPQTKTILYKMFAMKEVVRRDLRSNGIAAAAVTKEATAKRACECVCVCVLV